MKRTPKPFSVEIKKSRVPGPPHPLPPRRLFATLPAEATKLFQKEEPHAVIEPAVASRILPSILEPAWSASDAVEPIRRKRASRADQSQMELALKAAASEEGEGGPAEAAGSSEAVSQTEGAPGVQEDTAPVRESQPREADSAKAKSRKPRKKAPQAAEQEMASELMSEPEQALEAEVIEPSPLVIVRQSGHHKLAQRRAAAAELPRFERWKRRLHPAAW